MARPIPVAQAFRAGLLLALLALAGCADGPGRLGPGAVGLPPSGWSEWGPSFTGDLLVAEQDGVVAVAGDRFWLWNIATGEVEDHDLPETDTEWFGMDVHDGRFRLMETKPHGEMFSTPCQGAPPGSTCHGDGLREWYTTRIFTWLGDGWSAAEAHTSSTSTDPGPFPHGTGMDDAWLARTSLDGTTYSARKPDTWPVVRASGPAGERELPRLPCLGDGVGVANDGQHLYVAVDPDPYDQCVGGSRHLFRWNGTGWEASSRASPHLLDGRPLVSADGFLLLVGAPSLAYRDDGAWWPLAFPDLDAAVGYTPFSLRAEVTPYTLPWGDPPEPEWGCNVSWICPVSGWQEDLPWEAWEYMSVAVKDPLFSAWGQAWFEDLAPPPCPTRSNGNLLRYTESELVEGGQAPKGLTVHEANDHSIRFSFAGGPTLGGMQRAISLSGDPVVWSDLDGTKHVVVRIGLWGTDVAVVPGTHQNPTVNVLVPDIPAYTSSLDYTLDVCLIEPGPNGTNAAAYTQYTHVYASATS